MKRKLAALLCSVMCISAFTGCSTTELAYLNMSREMIDSMSSCAVDGTMQADIDFDGLNDFSKDMTEILYGEGYGTETGLTGKKSLKVDYDMNLNLEAMEYDMSFDVIYDGKTIDLGKMYYSLEKGVYVTSDTLWGVYQIYLDMADKTDSYIMSEAFAQDFRKVLAEEKYIELASMEQLTGVDILGLLFLDAQLLPLGVGRIGSFPWARAELAPMVTPVCQLQYGCFGKGFGSEITHQWDALKSDTCHSFDFFLVVRYPMKGLVTVVETVFVLEVCQYGLIIIWRFGTGYMIFLLTFVLEVEDAIHDRIEQRSTILVLEPQLVSTCGARTEHLGIVSQCLDLFDSSNNLIVLRHQEFVVLLLHAALVALQGDKRGHVRFIAHSTHQFRFFIQPYQGFQLLNQTFFLLLLNHLQYHRLFLYHKNIMALFLLHKHNQVF